MHSTRKSSSPDNGKKSQQNQESTAEEDQSDNFYDENINIKVPSPHEWYPEARKMKREIFFHMGPTNSGKTYEALKALREADTGIY